MRACAAPAPAIPPRMSQPSSPLLPLALCIVALSASSRAPACRAHGRLAVCCPVRVQRRVACAHSALAHSTRARLPWSVSREMLNMGSACACSAGRAASGCGSFACAPRAVRVRKEGAVQFVHRARPVVCGAKLQALAPAARPEREISDLPQGRGTCPCGCGAGGCM